MKKIVSVLALIILISGCAVQSNGGQTLSATKHEYDVLIVKSEVNVVGSKAMAKESASMREISENSDVVYEVVKKGGKDVITKLDNVVTTANKGWNLYINQEKQEFSSLDEITVTQDDQITWKYE